MSPLCADRKLYLTGPHFSPGCRHEKYGLTSASATVMKEPTSPRYGPPARPCSSACARAAATVSNSRISRCVPGMAMRCASASAGRPRATARVARHQQSIQPSSAAAKAAASLSASMPSTSQVRPATGLARSCLASMSGTVRVVRHIENDLRRTGKHLEAAGQPDRAQCTFERVAADRQMRRRASQRRPAPRRHYPAAILRPVRATAACHALPASRASSSTGHRGCG